MLILFLKLEQIAKLNDNSNTAGLFTRVLVTSDQAILPCLVSPTKSTLSEKNQVPMWDSLLIIMGNPVDAPSSFQDKNDGFLFGLTFSL